MAQAFTAEDAEAARRPEPVSERSLYVNKCTDSRIGNGCAHVSAPPLRALRSSSIRRSTQRRKLKRRLLPALPPVRRIRLFLIALRLLRRLRLVPMLRIPLLPLLS